MALIDFDEYIVPNYNYTLIDMIKSLSKHWKYEKTGSFSFQNAFFYLQFPNDDQITGDDDIQNELITQVKTQRKKKLNPHRQRSKYICRPETVIEVGNHFIWQYRSEYSVYNVEPEIAMLHHYRVRLHSSLYCIYLVFFYSYNNSLLLLIIKICEFGGDDCIKDPSVTDRTAHKYGDQLIERVQFIYETLKNRCDLPDL